MEVRSLVAENELEPDSPFWASESFPGRGVWFQLLRKSSQKQHRRLKERSGRVVSDSTVSDPPKTTEFSAAVRPIQKCE